MDTLLGRRIWLKRLFLRLGFISALFLTLSLAACTNSINLATPPSAGNEDPLDETAIQELVIEFGKKTSDGFASGARGRPQKTSLEENYGDLVSPDLLEKWIGRPH
jgi:hypothetical protein